MSSTSVRSRPSSDANEDSRPAPARRKRRHTEDELDANSDNERSQASPLGIQAEGSQKRRRLPVIEDGIEDGNDDESSEDDARFGVDDMSYRKSLGLEGGHDISHSWVNAVRSHSLLTLP